MGSGYDDSIRLGGNPCFLCSGCCDCNYALLLTRIQSSIDIYPMIDPLSLTNSHKYHLNTAFINMCIHVSSAKNDEYKTLTKQTLNNTSSANPTVTLIPCSI